MSDPILSLRNIETFYGPIMAIRGVSLDVHPGTIVTVLGANGAGKTTILKTISGVMDPGKGSVIFEGREIQKTDPDKVTRMGISHVPEGREVFPFLTVAENLQMGAYTRKDSAGIASDIDLVYEYFPRLKERHAQAAGSMSGGEQQMLAIGRALMARPKVILMDEPSLGLSPKLIKDIFEIIVPAQPRAEGDDPAGRAERQGGTGNRPFRLCAGSRPDRDGRHHRAADGKGRHQGILPRHEGRGRARQAALEETQDLALVVAVSAIVPG